MQRDLERTRHLEQIDLRARDVPRLDLLEEGDAAFLDHLAMPGRLHEGDPLRLGEPRMRRRRRTLGHVGHVLVSMSGVGIGLQVLATSDSWLSSFRTRIRAYGTTSPTRKRARPPQPFSFIRTLTVGFGIAPNLLTLLPSGEKKALAGLGYVTLTAGGDFHPALRTSAARNERPAREYDESPGRQQAPLAWGIGMSPCRRNRAHLREPRIALLRPPTARAFRRARRRRASRILKAGILEVSIAPNS